jgi:hypothetical protein
MLVQSARKFPILVHLSPGEVSSPCSLETMAEALDSIKV